MSIKILVGDAKEKLCGLPDESVHCVVTSPPYWGLRDYGVDGQVGLEQTLQDYIDALVDIFHEVRRVLRKDGTVWLNLGDSYSRALGKRGSGPLSVSSQIGSSDGGVGRADRPGSRASMDGLKPKDLCMMPARVALALQADGWCLRSEIIWHKPNPMPESVTDRPTSSHEKIYLLAKSERYYFDAEAVREAGSSVRPFNAETRGDGEDALVCGRASRQATGPSGFGTDGTRNIRNVWTIATAPFRGAHFATFPPALIEPCIKAGTSEKGCCPECGAPWTRLVSTTRQPDRENRVQDRAGDSLDAAHGKDGRSGNRYTSVSTTIGWQPACGCDLVEPIPCTVLDPFAGAGTVGLVADRLKRNAILIELNPDYAAMARDRLQADGGMFTEVTLS